MSRDRTKVIHKSTLECFSLFRFFFFFFFRFFEYDVAQPWSFTSVYRGFRAFVFSTACLRLFADEKRINERPFVRQKYWTSISTALSDHGCGAFSLYLGYTSSPGKKTSRYFYNLSEQDASRAIASRMDPSDNFGFYYTASHTRTIEREWNLHALTFEITFFQLSRWKLIRIT